MGTAKLVFCGLTNRTGHLRFRIFLVGFFPSGYRTGEALFPSALLVCRAALGVASWAVMRLPRLAVDKTRCTWPGTAPWTLYFCNSPSGTFILRHSFLLRHPPWNSIQAPQAHCRLNEGFADLYMSAQFPAGQGRAPNRQAHMRFRRQAEPAGCTNSWRVRW
jgi:hypothetical protein